MQELTRKTVKYKYFHIFKSNTSRRMDTLADPSTSSSSAAAAVDPQGSSKLKNEVTEAAEELGEYKSFLEREMLRRRDYSLLLFSRDGRIRKWATVLVNSLFFNFILVSAISLSVLSVLYPFTTDGSPADVALQVFVMTVLLSEVLLKWVVMGLFSLRTGTGTGGYFSYLLNNVDFATCVVIVVALITGDSRLRNTYIFRLSKFPALFGRKLISNFFFPDRSNYHVRYSVLDFNKSRLLDMIYKTIAASAPSLLLYILSLLVFCAFFAIVGMQLYSSNFGYCSYSGYPPFDGRYQSFSDPTSFPNGCNGLAYVATPSVGTDDDYSVTYSWKYISLNNHQHSIQSVKYV